MFRIPSFAVPGHLERVGTADLDRCNSYCGSIGFVNEEVDAIQMSICLIFLMNFFAKIVLLLVRHFRFSFSSPSRQFNAHLMAIEAKEYESD